MKELKDFQCSHAYNAGNSKMPKITCGVFNNAIECGNVGYTNAITGVMVCYDNIFCEKFSQKSVKKTTESMNCLTIAQKLNYNSIDEPKKNITNEAKDTKGKLDLTTVPPELIESIAHVREYGIKKYKGDNWRNVHITEYYKAIYRHWLAIQKGQVYDTESGFKHLSHIGCNVGFILALEGGGIK